MRRRRPVRGKSDSQANAEALDRRDRPYAVVTEASRAVAWDYRRRAPLDLRDAVRRARRAYADEVPAKLHDGPDAIGEDGTPRMTARAVAYIFGAPDSSDMRFDPETHLPDAISFYHSPFRATLATLERGDHAERRRARIVAHITIGQRGPTEAAIAEGAHPLDAKLVAFDALASFLRSMSDVRVHASSRTPSVEDAIV
jgi:hypothetical protein